MTGRATVPSLAIAIALLAAAVADASESLSPSWEPHHMSRTYPSGILLALASLVVIVAGLKAAAPLLTTFLLALFLALICLPLLQWMQRLRLGEVGSVLLLFFILLMAGSLLALLLGTSIADFTHQLPTYQARLNGQKQQLLDWLASMGVALNTTTLKNVLDPAAAMGMAGSLLTDLGKSLANMILILLTTIFLLFEALALPKKWEGIGEHAPSSEAVTQFLGSVNRYLAVKTWISLLTGALVWLLLISLGVDYPLLWGVLTFLFNFIPTIGPIIAAIPAVLLALVQLDAESALLVAGGYSAINLIISNGIEPRFMGRGVGLSPLVVFSSLVFWGWVLGPIGMLLSVPLTMVVKLALESRPQSRWLATLLG
ncbi:MAG: AI-2E family transporter [Mariprofundales bacterium]|nr:AI-2E family transporter [Mariprofundales bacterium]